MRALVIERLGPAADLVLRDMPVPEPPPGWVRIAVRAAGLNPADWKIVERGFPGWRLPIVAGLDPAGVVDACGEGTDFQPGERVFAHGSFATLGAYADFALAPAHVLTRMPEGLDFVAAAALPTAGLTAYQVIHRKTHLQPDQTILIHAGAGGVGGFPIQLARRIGARVLTTCSARNADFVRALGADAAIDYGREDVAARVRELTNGRGPDVILDTLGPATAAAAVGLLAFGGRLACCAGLPDLSRLQPLPRGITLHDISLGGAFTSGDRPAQIELARMGDELAALVADSRIDPMVQETVPLEAVPAALTRLAQGHQRGKLVARLD